MTERALFVIDGNGIIQWSYVSLNWQESGHELTMEEIQKAKEWLRMHYASSSCSSFA